MDDRILNKIKKCLALSQSPEPAEAAAALRQAQKLMNMHGVTQLDLGRFEVGEAEVQSKASVSRIKDWELSLMNIIAKAFGCKLLWMKSSSYSSHVYGSYILVGLKAQVQLAQYTCEVLLRKLFSRRASFVKQLPSYLSRGEKIIQADGFCHGWVNTISKTVYEFAIGEEYEKIIKDYADEKSTGKVPVQRREVGSYGLKAGCNDAEGESLHRPVSKQKQALLT